MTIEVNKAKEESNKKMKENKKSENGITLVALIITIIILIILAAVTIKVVTDMKIIQFAIKGTEDYSKAQDKEMEDFRNIENLLTDTISNIESGNTPTTPSESVNNPFTDADIGKYVNYVPVGTDYTAEAKYSGYTNSQVFSQDTSLKWKIWKVENDTLYLISDGLPSTSGYDNTGNLYLKGAQGYNNGVTILDNICQANYGINGNSNVNIQNLKLEDVLAVKAEGIIPDSAYETQPYTYSPSGTFAFPSIWYSNERESLELAQGNRSTAYPYVEEANTTISATGQKPYYTHWKSSSMNNTEAWKSGKYYNMIMTPAQSKAYWISSRYVFPSGSTSCGFGLQHVDSNGVNGNYLYYYNSGSPNNHNRGIRPLVSIPLRNCEITENTSTADTFDIVIK